MVSKTMMRGRERNIFKINEMTFFSFFFFAICYLMIEVLVYMAVQKNI
jgi:hypothetical protein